MSLTHFLKYGIFKSWPAVYSHLKKEWIAKQSAKPAL